MPRRKKLEIEDGLKEKLDYIGLDLQKVPARLLEYQDLNYKIIKNHDEKQYKQYRFINVKDIQILLSDTNRMNTVKEKYENARPLLCYLDYKNEENLPYYTTFMNMLRKVETYEIDKIEEEQRKISKKLPFKVKFEGNYLWQIYYSEYDDKYFMIVPTEDSDYSTFFYLLKKKIENKKDEKIFVPVSYEDYSNQILKKSEIKDLENYLWLFTKDYPLIYEVYDKKGKNSIQIIGETVIYGRIKTLYKVVLNNLREANKFYKLVKALFILASELPNYYNFQTDIDESGTIEFYLDNVKIEYENLPEFIVEQYLKSVSLKSYTEQELENLKVKFQDLKQEQIGLEAEYVAKEKQISIFLECKKTFFGKVKYFFKFGKKGKIQEKEAPLESKLYQMPKKKKQEKLSLSDKSYTLDQLIDSYKQLEIKENEMKNLVMDINALKLKNKNLKRKLKNATAYIEEINKHKRSIFEFWKYSNKDQVEALDEGEEEELNIRKLEKTFDFEDDFEEFGNQADKVQRKMLTDDELDSIYVASTNIFDLINRIYKKEAQNKEISEALKRMKLEKEEKIEDEEEIFDIFGKLNSIVDSNKTIGNKVHRETQRDIYKILDIKKGTKGIELKRNLDFVVKNIKTALDKNTLDKDIYVYKASSYQMELDRMQLFSLDIEKELNEVLSQDKVRSKVYLYKIKLNRGTNFLAFSNIIFYNNKNMTLPVGMNLSTKILVDLNKIELNNKSMVQLHKAQFENEKDDFSDMNVKTIEVIELEQ